MTHTIVPQQSATAAVPHGDGAQASIRAVPDRGSITQRIRLVEIISRRRGTAVVALVVGFVSAMLYAGGAAPVFQGRVQLLLDQEPGNPVGFKDVTDVRPTDDFYRTQQRLLQSRAVARLALRTLGVTSVRALRQEVGEPSPYRPFNIGVPTTAADEVAGREADRDDADLVDLFLSGITVSAVPATRLVVVTYEAHNGPFAARAANALAHGYIQRYMENRAEGVRSVSEWLTTRLAEQRRQVESAEQALQRYREEHNAGALSDRHHIVVQPLEDLNAALTAAKTNRIKSEAAYGQVVRYTSDTASLEAPAIASAPAVQQTRVELGELQHRSAQLGQRFGDLHPELLKVRTAIGAAEKRLHAEILKAIQSIRIQYETAAAEERGLAAAVEQQKAAAVAVNRVAIEDAALEREAATSRQIFQSVLERAKQTEVVGAVRSSAVQIVDAADVPRLPVRPNRREDLVRALAFGLLFAGCVVSFLETYDNRLSSREDVQCELGLALLGSVPLERRRRKAAALLMDSPNVSSAFGEAFNTIRTNVIFSQVEAGARVLVVTSANTGDGKSVAAINLAGALARMGQRVALVDADMRRPTLHARLNRDLEPGLSNVLTGQAARPGAFTETEMDGVWLLPAGHLPPRPNELLGSAAFVELLDGCRQEFDWVVVDTPPVLAVSDAAVVASRSAGVVFVIAADVTTRRQARNALAQLDTAYARVIGALLNRVDVGRYPYYYRDYERSAYHRYAAGRLERAGVVGARGGEPPVPARILNLR